MTEPLSDETLAEYANVASGLGFGYSPSRSAAAIRDLLAEVARLKVENAKAESDHDHTLCVMDSIDSTVANALDSMGLDTLVGTGFPWRVDALIAEVQRLRAENATLREDNARLVAALEAQGQAAFVAGMRDILKGALEGENST